MIQRPQHHHPSLLTCGTRWSGSTCRAQREAASQGASLLRTDSTAWKQPCTKQHPSSQPAILCHHQHTQTSSHGIWHPAHSPVGPMAPVGPLAPVGPVAPVMPVTPVAPVGPVAPLAPMAPVRPVAPAECDKRTNHARLEHREQPKTAAHGAAHHSPHPACGPVPAVCQRQHTQASSQSTSSTHQSGRWRQWRQ